MSPLAPAAHADTAPPPCVKITDLNCAGTFQNIQNGDGFIQVVNGTVTHSDVWPFRNPTLGPIWTHFDDPGVFPADYQWLRGAFTSGQQRVDAQNSAIADLTQQVQAQAATIARMRARINHLRLQVAQLQAELHRK